MAHVLINPTTTAIALCSKDFSNRRAFNFLSGLFQDNDDDVLELKPPTKNQLKALVKKFNNNQDNDAFQQARDGIEDVKNQAVRNIGTVLGNQEKVGQLVDSTEQLLNAGNLYRIRGNQVKRRMMTRNVILIMIVVALVLGVLTAIFLLWAIIAAAVSGGGDNHLDEGPVQRARIVMESIVNTLSS